MKFEFISQNAGDYPLCELCEALEVSLSGYHWRKNREPAARAAEDEVIKKEILQIHRRAKGEYGHRPVHQHLVQELGRECGRDRTLRLMQELGVAGTRSPGYKAQGTDSAHDFGYHPNRLKEHGKPAGADEVWVADTTYLKVESRWMYLATVMDLHSRRILGWSVSEKNDAPLVCRALENAQCTRGELRRGIIHHSDRGSTYACDAYQRLQNRLGMTSSMSARGNCYDNAAMESFYGRFKTSTIRDRQFAGEAQLREVVFEYIEPFYNRYRKHSSLGYRSPVEFEQMISPSAPAGADGEEAGNGGKAAFTQN